MFLKTGILALLLGTVSAMHLMYHGSELALHILHQQLFFIPLILASFWFGLRAGFVLAMVISLVYGIPMMSHSHESGSHLIVITQSFLYFFVALLIGWLSDRQRKQQRKLFQHERASALAKAASALSFEVQGIVKQIENIHRQTAKGGSEPANSEMASEIDRLKRLLEALAKFATPLGDLSLSHDLNDFIRRRLPTYTQNAAAKGIKIVVELDQGGCSSMVTTESIPRIIDSLVDNAIDFSESGQAIVLRSKRAGDFCTFEVADSGPGVSKENEAKLFSVFFTTKTDGYGISLSSGRKALRDLGGDLVYQANANGGAIFKMMIPRESP